MAESFLFSIATTVLEKITPFLAGEVRLAFKSDLKTLQETITNIKARLLDAEHQQHKNETLRLCMRNLRDIFYDAEDVLDEFHCNDQRREVWKNPSISKKVRLLTALSFDSISPVFSVKMRPKIREINQRLEKVYAEWNTFNLGVGADNRRVIRSERETHSFVDCSDVIGRDEDKENIISHLLEQSETPNIHVIPIVGIGGLGKTMLTQFVYNDERVVRHFPSRIWVCVSEEFDLTRLLKEIIPSITREKVEDSSLDTLQTQLRKHLSNKRFLLVLDDVWNENQAKWDQLRKLLGSSISSLGSKIIMTTRSEKVASIMAPNSPYYELQGLPHKDCMALFTRWAFRDGEERRYPNLMGIGQEIVRKCRGIPLAVRTLGSLLFSKTDEREWMSIRDSEIWTLEQSATDIMPVLKLSYDHLPSHLQQCLSFLSLYKKDYSYHSDDIISFWMANGLLERPRQREEWEDVGSRYLEELRSRCFIQDVQDRGFYFIFKMHDLIHDLAASVSQNECKILHSTSESTDEKIRHLSLYKDQHLIDIAQVLKKSKRVRTVMIQQGHNDRCSCHYHLKWNYQYRYLTKSSIGFCVSNFNYLRILDLRDSGLKALPDSISKLKHLRYLDLRGCGRIRKLPGSFYKLRNLLFLKMTGVGLMRLPESMQSLICLRCLEISIKASHLTEIRPGCWSSLQYFSLFECYKLQCLFDGIKYLTSLRTLHLNACYVLESLPRTLKFLTKLEHLEIHRCPNINLQMEPKEEDHHLHLSLKNFSIWRLPAMKDLPRVLLEGSSRTLQRIKIEECDNFEVLPAWLPNLTSLQKLEIIRCPKLSSLPEGMDRLKALRQLTLHDSPRLSERCRRDGGADWPKINQVQDVKLI